MKPRFVHNLSYSFLSFFDHTLLNEGQAFSNIQSGKLYNYPADRFSDYTAYYAPYGKQWVLDQSVENAIVSSGVNSSSGFLNYNSGASIDYMGGGVLLDNSYGFNQTIVSDYAIKDFNIYTTSDSDENVLFNNKIEIKNKFPRVPSGVNARNTVAPAIFIKMEEINVEPFQFGGTDTRIYNFKAIVWAKDSYSLDGVADVFTAKQHYSFMYITGSNINVKGNTKNNQPYNYLNDVASQYIQENLVYISNVDYISFKPSVEVSVDKNAYLGILEFNLEIPR